MTDDRPSVTDEYLGPILSAVDQYAFGTYITEEMRRLILKAYQQGRAKVIRDLAEERSKAKDPTAHFAEIRAKLDQLERNYLQNLGGHYDCLSREQAEQLAGEIQAVLIERLKAR